MNLYQIKNEYIQFAESLIENGGEITPENEYLLQINNSNLQNKGIQYGYVIKTMESEIDQIEGEIKRLTALKKSRVNSIERLKNTLADAMDLFGIHELKTATLKINFRKSESVTIENESLLDSKFVTVKTTIIPNKIAIKDAIKEGENVAGAFLSENKNLQIK